MSYISSINFQPTTNKNQLSHNDRSKPPSYLLPTDKRLKVECDKPADMAVKLRNSIISKAMQDYKNHVKQKFKAGSYLWSAVVNITPNTSIEELKTLANHFQNKYGFQCYQIAIHRDEGVVKESGEVVINHHAHMEFVTLDRVTGRSMFRRVCNKRGLSQIQNEVAELLHMERGKPKNDVYNDKGELIQKGTGLKHLSHFAYKRLMREKEVEANQKEKEIKEELTTQHDLDLKAKELEIERLKNEVAMHDQALQNLKVLCEVVEANTGKSLKPKETKQITESVVKVFKASNALCEALGVPKIYNQEDYINLRKTRDKRFKNVQELMEYVENLEKDKPKLSISDLVSKKLDPLYDPIEARDKKLQETKGKLEAKELELQKTKEELQKTKEELQKTKEELQNFKQDRIEKAEEARMLIKNILFSTQLEVNKKQEIIVSQERKIAELEAKLTPKNIQTTYFPSKEVGGGHSQDMGGGGRSL
ncbi:hypothetical protein [Helicobacter suis]|uniref:hypothetical protein n=1 Tax=Helicobacter suis TaxID=104628 RepID=UPI0019671994|nr:hypothetical protein [Helicobacter suis]